MIYAFDINKLDVVCKNAKIIILTDSVKYHTAKFKFSEDWENFSKTAYFINKSNDKDEKDISVPMFLGGNETVCLIPWEVLTREGQLIVSIQGVQDDTEIWTKMNRPIVLQKSDKDSNTMPQEPTIPIYNQLLNKLDSKGDSIQFEDDTLSLKSGDKVLSTARIKDETKDYESLLNIPTLNNIEIKGNKTANDYNIGNGLKVDEAKVTYKGEEISFKDFITQYIKDNETFAKLIENKAKKFDVNSPLSKEIGNGENSDILKLKDKSIDKQFLAQSIVDILENIDFADYSQYSTEDNFYDLSQLDENKTIFVNRAGYVGIANSFLYDWQAEEPTQKQNNVIYINANSFITVNKVENGYKSIYFITDENQYYFERITSNDSWKLYRTNLNAVYQTWQFAEQLDKTKQDNLVSGENIKTINNESILGSGNFELPKSPITIISPTTISDETKLKEGLYYSNTSGSVLIQHSTSDTTGLPLSIEKGTLLIIQEYSNQSLVLYSDVRKMTNYNDYINGLQVQSIFWNNGEIIKSNSQTPFAQIKDASLNIDLLTNILNNAIINKEENQLVVTSILNNETGRNNLKTIGTDNSLKIENEELSVNTNSLDISNSNITYDDTTTTLKNFVDVVNATFTNIENNQTSTIVKATNTTPYIELSTSGRYDVATNGTILIKEPSTKETTELYVAKGDIIYISTYGTSDTGQVLHHIDFIRLYSGDGINNLGIEYHKIAYNESKQKIINERKELTHSIETFWDMITPLLEIQKDQLISSEGIDDETGIPIFKVISLGMGLKLENNILSLDIENGDTLKYGTSTQSTKTNENEVVINE